MKTQISLAAAAITLLLSACGNGGAPAQPKGEISENRTAAFKSMMPDFSRMGKMVKGEEPYDVEKFKQAAAAFAESSKKPFTLFDSDPQGNGRALPAVWSDGAKFEAEKTKFAAAVEKLNAAAQTGKLDEIKAAYGETGASCKSCHDSFRAPE
ncbi:cytochrome c [Neisseria sp. Marseille-Q6792]|uniref:c-type cytochrome n=1 Tax=Neisseria sp. Marseille-Q6792 TaxID=2937985 RepID=UPI0020249C98|nr:cytochrome c [Neisseria sp. Marseille-Q6792]